MAIEEGRKFRPKRGKSAVASPGPRFSVDGDERLETHLANICEATIAGLKSVIPRGRLQAVWLGGGYGRGEGGVLRTAGGDLPYNDLEFYVCVAGNRFLNRRRFSSKLHALAEQLTERAGIEVELHMISMAELRLPKPNMFYHDLVARHRELLGTGELIEACDFHRDAANLSLAEATRLLMNRGTGLLLARERLNGDPLPPDSIDFIRRNIAKAQLAVGDAVLTAFGQYNWSCRERHRRLLKLVAAKTLPWFEELCQNHDAGVQFKLHPWRGTATRAELRGQLQEITALMLPIWLWLESKRLGRGFLGANDYALWPGDKCPETNRWRNRLINLRLFGWAGLFTPARHPRQRILSALPLLLWSDDKSPEHLARLLPGYDDRGDAESFNLPKSYKLVWQQVR